MKKWDSLAGNRKNTPRNTMAWDGEKSYKNRGEKLGATVEGGPFLRRIPINHHLQGGKLIGSPPNPRTTISTSFT